jgi:titin
MPPAAPTGLTVSNPGVTTLTLSWAAAPTAAQVSGYLLSVDGTAVPATSPYIVTGLVANSSHAFTVTAVNATGNGPASAVVNGLTLPEAPSALATGTVTSTSIALSWAAPVNAVGLGYQLQGLPAGASVTYSSTTALASGLAPNATYTFTVLAVNAAGASVASNPASGLTLPAAPTGLAAGTITASSIALAWAAPANGATSYVILGAPGTATVSISGTTASVSGLAVNTSYTLSVAAVNASGQGPASAPITAKTLMVVPGTPDCCTASAATPTSVVVNWVAPATGPATSYTIQRSRNSTFPANGGGTQTATNIAGTSQSYTGLNANTVYYFRVQAVNAVGTSAYSATFSFQPPAPPPTPAAPTATAAPASTAAPTVTLAFAAPAAGVTYTVYQQSRVNGGGGGGAAWSAATVAATGVTGTGWTSGALAPNLQVRYYLVAVNAVASSPNGATSNTVTTQQLANAPVGLATSNGNGTIVVRNRGGRSVTLNLGWALGAPNGTTVTAVRLVRATGATLAGNLITSNLAATATATTVTRLAPNTTYTFQVQAVTAGGVSGSTTVTLTTTP